MKPTTQDRIAEVIEAASHPSNPADLRATIERVLREQDRDTRHACAEAVSAISLEEWESGRVAAAIILQRAHQVVMNATAI